MQDVPKVKRRKCRKCTKLKPVDTFPLGDRVCGDCACAPPSYCLNCDSLLEDGRKRYCCCRFVGVGGVRCVAPLSTRGWCAFHRYEQNRGYAERRSRDTCGVPSCGALTTAGGRLCKRHHGKSRRFGLSASAVIALYTKANSCCESCGLPEAGSLDSWGVTLSVDHDHRHCEKGCPDCVVGLLCRKCNYIRTLHIMEVAEYVLRKCKDGRLDLYREGVDMFLQYVQNDW